MLTLCREFGQAPSWWDTLTTDDQARLLGWLRWRGEQARKGAP